MQMNENQSTTLQSVLRFALPLGTNLIVGSPDTVITWVVTVRAQPPAFPEVYGGELALVSMRILRAYDNRMSVESVVGNLADVGVAAIAIDEQVNDTVIALADEYHVSLLTLPPDENLTRIERAVTTLIVNQSAQLNQRAIEIQRQLTRYAAENRDLNTLLQVIARATVKPLLVHDDAGVLIAQAHPNVGRRGDDTRHLLRNLPYDTFQRWLEDETPSMQGVAIASPLGYTTVLKVEKRIAGYMSLIDGGETLDDFDRLVLTYGADVCAIEMAKSRAVASAIEQTRGDWVQMWLSGTQTDDDMILTRAEQTGFDANVECVVVIYRATTEAGALLPVEGLMSLVQDDMARRQGKGAVGQYVDVIVALYPVDGQSQMKRVHLFVDDVRQQLATRTPSGIVSAGISRPAIGLAALRDAYREAKDAISIASELGERGVTTFYGDLKLYQLLLALKEHNLHHLQNFYRDTLGKVVEYDEKRQADLVRTLEGFFAANGNLAKAAADLDVHRNTLVYRLERVKELTELDLDDSDNRLILHLALKIQRVLATLPTGAVDKRH
ncbi:MAG: hypothetical protein D6737_03235 [Chloroflexi bacterium]|nr:MAG: hypothetical protein CUN54_04485 [Phototrophicales bacterium]RMF82019.1 MAG: hypothetical protein D6737_03235 [Chloroflexota bacterium]